MNDEILKFLNNIPFGIYGKKSREELDKSLDLLNTNLRELYLRLNEINFYKKKLFLTEIIQIINLLKEPNENKHLIISKFNFIKNNLKSYMNNSKVLEMLDSKDWRTRIEAVRASQGIKDEKIIEKAKQVILELLYYKDLEVRIEAVRASQGISDEQTIEEIKRQVMLESSYNNNEYVKLKAVRAIQGIKDEKIIEKAKQVIFQLLNRKNLEVRIKAFETSQIIDDLDFRKQVVLKVLDDKDKLVKLKAVRASQGIKDEKIIEKAKQVILELLYYKDLEVRIKAFEASQGIDNLDFRKKAQKILKDKESKIDLNIRNHKLYQNIEKSFFESMERTIRKFFTKINIDKYAESNFLIR